MKMSEEKTKTVMVSTDKLGELIDDFGTLKLSNLPANTHFVAKIIEAVSIKEVESHGLTIYSLMVEYHDPAYEPVQFKVQIGEGAAQRLNDKFPEQAYVGMNAYFSKTKYGLRYPQFVNPFVGTTETKKPAFVKKSGGVSPMAKPKVEAQLPFVAEIIKYFVENPGVFTDEYLQTSLRDGTTAPWKFIDDFKTSAVDAGEDKDKFSNEYILKIYKDLVAATQDYRVQKDPVL